MYHLVIRQEKTNDQASNSNVFQQQVEDKHVNLKNDNIYSYSW